MNNITYLTDSNGRIRLPKSFVNYTVVVEQRGENELRIRRTKVIPENVLPIHEQDTDTVLSNNEREWFFQLLENPPSPNEALRKLLETGDATHEWSMSDAPVIAYYTLAAGVVNFTPPVQNRP